MKRTIATLALLLPLTAAAQTVPTAASKQDEQLSQCLTLAGFAFQVTTLRDKGVPMESHLSNIMNVADATDSTKRIFGSLVRDIYLNPEVRRAPPAAVQLVVFKACVRATLTY